MTKTNWLSRRTWRTRFPVLYAHRTLVLRVLVGYFFLLPLFLWLMLGHILVSRTGSHLGFPAQLRDGQHVLVVLAHPDDESLFFSPTILSLTQRRPKTLNTGLLVLSSGNHYGKGVVRQKELRNACATLGIRDDHCKVLDREDIRDDPTVFWPYEKVEAIVEEYVHDWKVDAMVTFDDGGVSGHSNHIAVSDAIVKYVTKQHPSLPVYTLTTTNILRKYSLLGDLPLTVLYYALKNMFLPFGETGKSALFVNSFSLWAQGVAAFQKHASQNSWDRHIYVVISRYMWFNDLRLVEAVKAD